MLDRLRSAFEPGSLFVELQDHDLVEQPVLNKILIECAQKLELPLVATNDVHYLAQRRRRRADLFVVRAVAAAATPRPRHRTTARPRCT